MPTKVLLSIKPDFVEKIFADEKHYEFRRVIFSQEGVKTAVVYASSPVQKVVGQFEIESVLKKSVQQLWRETRRDAGIAKSYFEQYFAGKETGYALKIKSRERYKTEKCLAKDFGIKSPPQSFCYLD